MENTDLDANTDRVACLLVQKTTSLLDALDTLLGLQRNVVPLIRILDAIGVIIRRKLKLRSIFVTLV